MTKNLKISTVGLLILGFLGSSCQHLNVPKGPSCRILTNSVFCVDTSYKEGNPNREFELTFQEARGFYSTPPKHYKKIKSFMLDSLEELETLRRNCDVYYTE